MAKSYFGMLKNDANAKIKLLGRSEGIEAFTGAVAFYKREKELLDNASDIIKSAAYFKAKTAFDNLGIAILEYALKDGKKAVSDVYKAAGIKEDFSGKPKLPFVKADEKILGAENYIDKLRNGLNNSGLELRSAESALGELNARLSGLRNLLENKE